jgi:C4-dicarboxylate-specific signal transduction histidine kinase
MEHIKEIVAMQQSYAQRAGVVELQSIPLLVEDALRMYDGALGRHQVRIVRQFEDVPSVPVDKHKVLQILVNLISNAKHALTRSRPEDRVLTLRVSHCGQEGARIAVSDNGAGISSENLTRIFSHGFTTRQGGHGFGLHSAALAARDMGGALRAESAGPGRGATFTLDLPASPPNVTS